MLFHNFNALQINRDNCAIMHTLVQLKYSYAANLPFCGCHDNRQADFFILKN
uniref:Uncharacterized protein n=1 Tax=Rhizophora mucronata TaxID=61149 RepID=A0A2P2Q6Y9_RHIMU